ncbi:transposase [Anatilimnocola aggregata]|nr:transposase [Anatilimnocola aggregata]
MPRRKRSGSAGFVFHVLNRAAGGWKPFDTDDDYQAFLRVIAETQQLEPLRLLAYALMPNHWHLIVWPQTDEQLTDFMQRATTVHAQRWHQTHGTQGRGALYQGRFKAFPVQDDDHFYTVCRYVERNALRASLVSRAEDWRWSSLWQRQQQRADVTLSNWPLPLPADWCGFVNQPQTEAELDQLRKCIRLGIPFGGSEWRSTTSQQLGLSSEEGRRGRPRRPE